jgi:hypothetical protein
MHCTARNEVESRSLKRMRRLTVSPPRAFSSSEVEGIGLTAATPWSVSFSRNTRALTVDPFPV